jgi:hypothetical protein
MQTMNVFQYFQCSQRKSIVFSVKQHGAAGKTGGPVLFFLLRTIQDFAVY